MLYNYYAGDPAQALRAFDRCCREMDSELQVEPTQETRSIANQIRAGTLWAVEGAPRYPPPAYEGVLFSIPYSLGRPPFVGRQREYSWLVDQWRRKPHGVILLEGGAGAGKTRLAEQFAGYVTGEGQRVVSVYLEAIEATPYAAWLAALGPLDELPSPERTGERWETADFRDQSGQDILARIASTLIMRYPQGVLVWIDDAHRLDPASLEALPTLAEHALLLLTIRSEESATANQLKKVLASLRSSDQYAHLVLQPLSLEAVRELICRLGGDGLDLLAAQLYSQTAGNPFFLIATLQHMFEQGALVVSPKGGWMLVSDQPYSLAPSLSEAIENRLQHLGTDQRRILNMAAVITGDFDFTLIQQASQISEETLLGYLDDLINSGWIIEPMRRGRGEFAISHQVYTRAVYESLPQVRRRQLHRRLATALEFLRGSEASTSAQIAHHFHQGEMLKEAVLYSIRAGQYALSLYAAVQAVEHFTDANTWITEGKLFPEAKVLADLHMGWAEALRLSGKYDAAIQHYRSTLPVASGEVRQAAAFQICVLGASRGAGLELFDRLTTELEASLEQEEESWALAMLRWTQGMVAFLRGDVLQARGFSTAGWRIARRIRKPQNPPPAWLLPHVYTGMIRMHEQWGSWHRSWYYARKLLRLVESLNDRNGIAVAHQGLGGACLWLGEWRQAIEYLEKTLQLSTEAGDPRLQGEALYRLGWIAIEQGNLDRAEQMAVDLRETASASHNILHSSMGQILFAKIWLARSQAGRAAELLQPLCDLARQTTTMIFLSQVQVLLAQAYLQNSQLELAVRQASQAIETAQTCKVMRDWEAALWIRGNAELKLGRLEQAGQDLHQAKELAQRLGCRIDLGRIQYSLGMLWRQTGDGVQANRCFEQAMRLFEELGAVPDIILTQEVSQLLFE